MGEQPAPRTVVLVHADAPQLPFVATALGVPFTAVSRDGWSAVVLPQGVDSAALAAAGDPGSIAVEVYSDGASRRLRVHPPVSALEAHRDWGAQLAELAPSTTVTWDAAGTDEVEALAAHPSGSGAPAADPPPSGFVASRPPEPRGDEPAGEQLSPRGTGRDTQESMQTGAPAAQDPRTAVESIASLCDLDPAATSRLRNYAESKSSVLLLESVLQLLGLPVVAAKIVEGQRELDELEGVAQYAPRGRGFSLLDSASVEPSGADLLSRIQRVYVRRPSLLLALGGAEVVLGAGLAGLASRGGRGARALGSASALMFSDAALQAALWASVRARRNR